jgi:hypothetical protein
MDESRLVRLGATDFSIAREKLCDFVEQRWRKQICVVKLRQPLAIRQIGRKLDKTTDRVFEPLAVMIRHDVRLAHTPL